MSLLERTHVNFICNYFYRYAPYINNISLGAPMIRITCHFIFSQVYQVRYF